MYLIQEVATTRNRNRKIILPVTWTFWSSIHELDLTYDNFLMNDLSCGNLRAISPDGTSGTHSLLCKTIPKIKLQLSHVCDYNSALITSDYIGLHLFLERIIIINWIIFCSSVWESTRDIPRLKGSSFDLINIRPGVTSGPRGEEQQSSGG